MPKLLLHSCNKKTSVLFYLLDGITPLNTVKKRNPVTLDDVDLSKNTAYQLYQQGLNII